jgi:hypothetical protein
MASESDLKEDWKRVDRALIPEPLLGEMPQPECTGLTMLTDVMINATVCKLGPRIGQITAQYCHDIEIVLDVAKTIERRIQSQGRWRLGQPIVGEQRIDRHLAVWVQCSDTGVKDKVCIVSTGGVVPAIDDCVSFILWAETGFLNPPFKLQLDDKILYVRDPDLYERNRAEAREVRKRERRIRLLSQELRIEKGLARSKALLKLELERQRVRNLGWHELIAEHESAGQPTDAVSRTLYDLRISLLSMPAPGHPQ